MHATAMHTKDAQSPVCVIGGGGKDITYPVKKEAEESEAMDFSSKRVGRQCICREDVQACGS